MTVEIHAKLITLLAEVDDLKSKEAALKSEKQRHLEQIANFDTTYMAIRQIRYQISIQSYLREACPLTIQRCFSKWKKTPTYGPSTP